MSQKELKYLKEGGMGTNYYKQVKEFVMKILKVAATLSIIWAYLSLLGLEASQDLKYVSSLTFEYLAADVPRLLPMHQFVSFDADQLKDRIKCKVFGDTEECQKIEIKRCELKGKTSEAYEVCMLALGVEKNGTVFCENHYATADLWVDNLSPNYLMFYLRKHNCFALSGLPKGKSYCQDYFDHEDSWDLQQKFDCYSRNNV